MIYSLVDYALNITKVNPNEVAVHVSSPFDIVSLVASIMVPIITAVAGGVIAYLIQRSQSKQQRTISDSQSELERISAKYQLKQLELTSMLKVFEILNSHKHRQARESIFCAYYLCKKGDNNIFDREPYHSTAAMVRADMDQIGLLIDDGLVDEAMFLKAYWNTVLVTWKALEKNIEHERSTRNYPAYMSGFKALNEKALEYRRANNLGSGEIFVYQNDDCAKKFDSMTVND